MPRLSRKRLLIINPNSTQNMTNSLLEMVRSLGKSAIFEISFYTAPSGPPSINSNEDAAESADVVIKDLVAIGDLDKFDAFLVACYSVHPLVTRIRENVKPSIPVMGIFEASIGSALMSLPLQGKNTSYPTFGIISTGSYWDGALTDGVLGLLGVSDRTHLRVFEGVRTTGLSATELHIVDQSTVSHKVKDATKSLISGGDCKVVILGCAGMAGMEDWVREAIVEELGEDKAEHVTIVDGVKAGLVHLEGIVRIHPERGL